MFVKYKKLYSHDYRCHSKNLLTFCYWSCDFELMWLFMWYEIFCASCQKPLTNYIALGSNLLNQISLWNEACLDMSMKGWSRCISPKSISDYSACGCAFHLKNLRLLWCRADVLRSCMDNRFRHGHVHEKLGQMCDVSVLCKTLGHTTEGCWICQQMGVK